MAHFCLITHMYINYICMSMTVLTASTRVLRVGCLCVSMCACVCVVSDALHTQHSTVIICIILLFCPSSLGRNIFHCKYFPLDVFTCAAARGLVSVAEQVSVSICSVTCPVIQHSPVYYIYYYQYVVQLCLLYKMYS